MRRSILFLGLLFLAGCSSPPPTTGTVEGTIFYKGRPVNGAALVLHPTAAGSEEQTFLIPVTQEGIFRTPNVPPGDYKVVVEVSKGGAGPSTAGMSAAKLAEVKEKLEKMKTVATIPIPSRYKSLQTTPLKQTIAAGEQKLTIELTD